MSSSRFEATTAHKVCIHRQQPRQGEHRSRSLAPVVTSTLLLCCPFHLTSLLRYAPEIVVEVVLVVIVTFVVVVLVIVVMAFLVMAVVAVVVLVRAVVRVVPMPARVVRVPVRSMMVVCLLYRQSFAMRLPYGASVKNECCRRRPRVETYEQFYPFSFSLSLFVVLRSLCSAPLRYANLPPHPPGAYLACNKCKCTYFENAALIIMYRCRCIWQP
jgi:hypothetical protein